MSVHPSLSQRIIAWTIHIYTASGVIWGLFALMAVIERRLVDAEARTGAQAVEGAPKARAGGAVDADEWPHSWQVELMSAQGLPHGRMSLTSQRLVVW